MYVEYPHPHRNTVNTDHYPQDERLLRQKLQNDPSDWESRRHLAHVLYDKNEFYEAAEVIWRADHIPSNDIDLAYAARILAKAQPRKAIRLLAAVLELNRGKSVQNMGMANALLHHGMVLQAARFYGAALEADPTLVNPDLEHFILWTDDEMCLWADFKDCRPKLGELPWMARDPMEALKLTSRVSLHTTPISVPSLPTVPGEDILNDLYQQEMKKRGKITPPPAVTIPIDRVNPKDRRFDEKYGAEVARSNDPAEPTAVVSDEAPPEAVTTEPASAPPSGPITSPMPPRMPGAPVKIAVPMAIPVPDHVVPIASATPTVSIAPPPPRTPASVAGTGVTLPPGQDASPTRRLLTPGGRPTPTSPPTAPATPPKSN
jgi:hypothetical protein